jgi:hypothetical protein
MKKIFILFAVVGLVAFSSCTGDDGQQGPPGEDGLPGYINKVFEVVNVNFNTSNDFLNTYDLTQPINSDDSILVYELVDTSDGIDTWALLPQVYYLPQGTAQYNYNFSFDRFTILMDASFDMKLLPNSYTSGKIFRVVIIPGQMTSKSVNKVDYSDYNAVIKKYNIDDSNVKRLN